MVWDVELRISGNDFGALYLGFGVSVWKATRRIQVGRGKKP